MKETITVLDGIRTRALEVAGDGPAILLIHGFSDSADSWRPLLAELERLGRRAVAVDLPGSGRAEALPRGAVLPPLDAFTEAFVAAYAPDGPAILAGNSLGGLLALRMAQRGGAGLAAIAPISPAGLAFHRRAQMLAGGAEVLVPLLRLGYRVPVPARVVRTAAARLYRERIGGPGSDPELALLYAGHLRGMRDVRRFGRIARLLSEELPRDEVDPAQIRLPTLLIWGRHDRVCDVAGAVPVLTAVPESELVVLERAGHCPQVQKPVEIAELLAGLPGSLRRSRAGSGTAVRMSR